MLDQPFMTDIIEASSISHMPQVIDIYSASWGPTDNGKTVDGPRELTLQAMADGVNKVTNNLSFNHLGAGAEWFVHACAGTSNMGTQYCCTNCPTFSIFQGSLMFILQY